MNRVKVRLRNPFASQEYECYEETFAGVGKPVVFFVNHKKTRKLMKIIHSNAEFEVVLEPFNDNKFMCEHIIYKGEHIYLKGVD